MKTILFNNGPNRKNSPFDPNIRDGLNLPYIALKDYFNSKDIKLIYTDEIKSITPDFELHQNIQKSIFNCPAFVLLWETKFIYPKNYDYKILDKYLKIFSWDEDIVKEKNAIKFRFPHFLNKNINIDGYKNRSRLINTISGNKCLTKFKSEFDLYSERVKTIRWFEDNFPNDFDLYGSGWNKSARLPNFFGSLINKFQDYLWWEPFKFKSWKGIIDSKHNILSTSRFSIVYENVKGLDDYITEKIFDCFNAGNIPVYWGAPNISEYIPEKCFIDRRNFRSHLDLYKYIKTMQEDEYIEYQINIKNFLNSELSQIFSLDKFAKNVTSQIVAKINKL